MDRLRRSGMSVREISDALGLQPVWVAEIVEMLPDEEPPGEEEDHNQSEV